MYCVYEPFALPEKKNKTKRNAATNAPSKKNKRRKERKVERRDYIPAICI